MTLTLTLTLTLSYCNSDRDKKSGIFDSENVQKGSVRALFYYHFGSLWGLAVEKKIEKYTKNYDLRLGIRVRIRIRIRIRIRYANPNPYSNPNPNPNLRANSSSGNGLFATGGDDMWLNIWCSRKRILSARTRTNAPIRCCDFDSNNDFLAVGFISGSIAVYGYYDPNPNPNPNSNNYSSTNSITHTNPNSNPNRLKSNGSKKEASLFLLYKNKNFQVC
jgi:hypothetical protein